MADISSNIEMSDGFFTFHQMGSSKIFYTFEASGAAAERLIAKDPTGGSQKGNCFHLETFNIRCQSADVRFMDGSASATTLFTFNTPSATEPSRAGASWRYDYRPDAIKCLTADNTQSLCVSAGNGHWVIQMSGWWGNV